MGGHRGAALHGHGAEGECGGETTRDAGCKGDMSGVGDVASDSLCVGHVAGEYLCACVLRLDLLGLLSVVHTYVCLL